MADKRNFLDKVESFSLVVLLASAAGTAVGVVSSLLYWLICG